MLLVNGRFKKLKKFRKFKPLTSKVSSRNFMVMTSQAIVARSTRARKKVPVKNTLLQTLLLDNAECLLKNQSSSFE